MTLDTTHIGSSTNKVYSALISEDRSKIMVFKINSKNKSKFILTTLLFDNQLNLQKRSRFLVPMGDVGQVAHRDVPAAGFDLHQEARRHARSFGDVAQRPAALEPPGAGALAERSQQIRGHGGTIHALDAADAGAPHRYFAWLSCRAAMAEPCGMRIAAM